MQVCDFACREAQDFPQEEGRALLGRQVLQCGDERQAHGMPLRGWLAGAEPAAVNAGLPAMTEADQELGWGQRPEPVILAVTVEPCLMCMGAAMTMGVSEICTGSNSKIPIVVGAVLRQRCQKMFERYAESATDAGMRRWASALASLPVRD